MITGNKKSDNQKVSLLNENMIEEILIKKETIIWFGSESNIKLMG